MERIKKMESLKKWKMLVLFVLALGFSLTSWSQAAVPEARADSWAKAYGTDKAELINSIQQTDDDGDGQRNDGYIAAGWTTSGSGGRDFFILKTDSSGNKQWAKNLEGVMRSGELTFPGYESAESIQQTSDGGYIVTGSGVNETVNGTEFIVLKLDSNGNKQWAKSFGGTDQDGPRSIQQTDDDGDGQQDDGYIVAGTMDALGKILIIKLDSNGNKSWARSFDVGGHVQCRSIQQTDDDGDGRQDDGYIMAGSTSNSALILKVDSSGTLQWTNTLKCGTSNTAWSIQQTDDDGDGRQDDGYIVAGQGAHSRTALIYKLDSLGRRVWGKGFRGVNGRDDAFSVQQTNDRGYIVSGQSADTGGYGFLMLKLDLSGDQEWARIFGKDDENEVSYSVQQTLDGGYVAAGYTTSARPGFYDSLIVKLNSSGNIPGCVLLKELDMIQSSCPAPDNFITPVENYIPAITESSLDDWTLSSMNDLVETDACADSTPPTLTTEAWIPDNGGTYIADGDTVNLDDIDEAGEKITIYSTASDPAPSSGIQDQKIKWWRYDSGGALIGGGSGSEIMGDGSYSLTINGPLNDGDRIEYTSQATDNASPPNTAYDPASGRHSFTVVVPPTLSVSLSANPNSGSAPLNNVDLTAAVGGSATGNIRYRFDCTDDGVWESDDTVGANPYTKNNLCSYAAAGNYTARVEVTRQGITVSGTVGIAVNSPNTPPTALFNAVPK